MPLNSKKTESPEHLATYRLIVRPLQKHRPARIGQTAYNEALFGTATRDIWQMECTAPVRFRRRTGRPESFKTINVRKGERVFMRTNSRGAKTLEMEIVSKGVVIFVRRAEWQVRSRKFKKV